jgi:hypothetical protein
MMEAVGSSEMSLPTDHNNSYLRKLMKIFTTMKTSNLMIKFSLSWYASQLQQEFFFLLQSIQICSGAHPASYSVSTIGTLPESNEARYESDHYLPLVPWLRVNGAIPHSKS